MYHSVASNSSGWRAALTFPCAWVIRPSGPITYVIRGAYSAPGESQAPYIMPTVRAVSHNSGYGKLNLAAKAAFSSTVSKLIPRI